MQQQYVSPKTAQLLKEAGFPPPEPEVGQVWYNKFDSPSIVAIKTGERVYKCHAIGSDNSSALVNGKIEVWGLVYAPTAVDILRELEGDYALRFRREMFLCTRIDGHYIAPESDWHENAAEATAARFLALRPTPA